MSKQKKSKKTKPGDVPRFDEAAAAQMAADVAASDKVTGSNVESDSTQADAPKSLETQLAEAKDRVLRTQAELENYRKRAHRDQQVERRYAHLFLMRDLLPVLDNMDRAIEAAEQTHDTHSLLKGVKMVAEQLHGVLGKFNCVEIEALEGPFDPHLHEAILQQPSDEHPAGTVLQVTQTGYQLHDRVVRPAQVIVSTENRPPTEEEPDESEAPAEPEDTGPREESSDQ